MDITLQINGQSVKAKEGMTIMEVATSLGLYIPHFCYHPKLSIAANCRMCLVDVEKSPKPLPACATAAVDGMVVQVDSDKAKEAQNSVMEFLLINHPLDCPICDQGGECQLQDLAVGYGMSKSRYQEEKRVVLEKNLGPLISTDMTRCIHCTRCVRFGREVGGIMELGMAGRGEHAEIMPFIERTVNSELSGNMIDVCPVGALTSKPFRFSARPWELRKKRGIATHDSWGSHLLLHIKEQTIKRVTPKEHDDINQCWISDRDRFSYTALQAKDRVRSPSFRQPDARQFDKVPWEESIGITVNAIKKAIKEQGADKIGFFASPSSTNEELFLLQKIARGLGCENMDSRLRQRDFSAPIPSEYNFRINQIADASMILFVGASLADEIPLLAARLRTRRQRPQLLSLSSQKMAGRFPFTAEESVRPSTFAENLYHINCMLGPTKTTNEALFNVEKSSASSEAIFQHLNQRKDSQGDKYIILGAAACESPQLHHIIEQANILAESIGAKVGVLGVGANGTGARRVGFFPQQSGLNTQQMLQEDLAMAFMFNCEPADFVEQARAESCLLRAGFVCGITSHLSGLEQYADVILPTAVFGENEGTLTNGEGVQQQFTAVVSPPNDARPGWKILRVLGEALAIDGFDFNSLEDVRKMMTSTESNSQTENLQSQNVSENQKQSTDAKESTWELVGGYAPYNLDMIVRRSEPLQKTALGKKTNNAFMHSQDMNALRLNNGDYIRLDDGIEHWNAPVFADDNIARGVIGAYPPNLQPHGITVRALSEQELDALLQAQKPAASQKAQATAVPLVA